MALLARHGGMESDEGKMRHVMIKDHLLVPLPFVVAA